MVSPRKWSPLPQQSLALNSEADIVLYGGAGGGGKTDLLLGTALEHTRCLILRRISKNLEGIIDRSKEIYKPPGTPKGVADYVESPMKRWRFSNGKQIRFDSIQLENDKENFRGIAHDYYGFDEITEFSEAQFRFVTGWNRSTKIGQRCRVIATCNPPTTGDGEWVISYWGAWLDPNHPNPAKPGELRWYTTVNKKDFECPNSQPIYHEGEKLIPKSRTFIPAKVEDNPYLMDANYIATLQALPEPLRSLMLKGDFTAGREDAPYQVFPTAWVVAAQKRWREAKAPTTPMTRLGCDVARGGDDRNVLTPARDNYYGPQFIYPGKATPSGPDYAVLVETHRSDDCPVNIDIIGVGSSPFDCLVTSYGSTLVYAMNGSCKSTARDKSNKLGFFNSRAEWHWKLREDLDPDSGMDIMIPDDPELKQELTTIRWKLTTRGIQVEAKEEIKERLGRSPDKSDSLIYAHAIPHFAGSNLLAYYASQQKKAEAAKLLAPASKP